MRLPNMNHHGTQIHRWWSGKVTLYISIKRNLLSLRRYSYCVTKHRGVPSVHIIRFKIIIKITETHYCSSIFCSYLPTREWGKYIPKGGHWLFTQILYLPSYLTWFTARFATHNLSAVIQPRELRYNHFVEAFYRDLSLEKGRGEALYILYTTQDLVLC